MMAFLQLILKERGRKQGWSKVLSKVYAIVDHSAGNRH